MARRPQWLFGRTLGGLRGDRLLFGEIRTALGWPSDCLLVELVFIGWLGLKLAIRPAGGVSKSQMCQNIHTVLIFGKGISAIVIGNLVSKIGAEGIESGDI